MQITFSEYMQDLLHNISQGLLVPTMVVLALCVAFSVFALGSIIAEFFTERRRFRANMPDFLARIGKADIADLDGVIDSSGLLYRQRHALAVLVRYFPLPEESRVSLAKRLLASLDQRYEHRVRRTDTLAKISPMLGLMGTLIPLGPGIVALGQGQTEQLSSSLMIAFDTTIVGLVTAVVCFAISRIRRSWYEDYTVSMEASLTALLEKSAQYDGPTVADMTDDEIASLAPVRPRLFGRLKAGKAASVKEAGAAEAGKVAKTEEADTADASRGADTGKAADEAEAAGDVAADVAGDLAPEGDEA